MTFMECFISGGEHVGIWRTENGTIFLWTPKKHVWVIPPLTPNTTLHECGLEETTTPSRSPTEKEMMDFRAWAHDKNDWSIPGVNTGIQPWVN